MMFFVDAETDGLYGDFISIGVSVTDDGGAEVAHFYMAAKEVFEREDLSQWVRENVIPYVEPCSWAVNEAALLEEFWKFWMKYREQVFCIADVPCPVESRLFQKCVEADLESRAFLAPYPLLDLSSMMLICDFDPLSDRKDFIHNDDIVQHNALEDARMNGEIWKRLINLKGKGLK